MSMALVNAIRKLGWPDSNGHWQYGNAAILCYLSRYNNAGKKFVERYKDVRVVDLMAKMARTHERRGLLPAVSSFTSLLEMAFSIFVRSLPHIA